MSGRSAFTTEMRCSTFIRSELAPFSIEKPAKAVFCDATFLGARPLDSTDVMQLEKAPLVELVSLRCPPSVCSKDGSVHNGCPRVAVVLVETLRRRENGVTNLIEMMKIIQSVDQQATLITSHLRIEDAEADKNQGVCGDCSIVRVSHVFCVTMQFIFS